MCDLANERIRIDKILNKAADDWDPVGSASLLDVCVAALEAVYHDACVEECLRRRAAEFVSTLVARRRAA